MKSPIALPVIGLIVCIGIGGVVVGAGQASDASLQTQLEQLFPEAIRFSPKTGNPPHFKVYGRGPDGGGEPVLAGFAFYTTDVEPLERGYDGPIQILIGMDLHRRVDRRRRHRPQRTVRLLLGGPAGVSGAV